MDFFKLSTHSKGLLSPDEINQKRKAAHEAAYSGVPESGPRITYEESCLIRRYYQEKISGVCSFLKLPRFVQPVAHWYYMRYFMKQSILRYDMKHVMLTCILLATKLENMHLSAAEFTDRIPNCQRELMPVIELALLDALDFNLLFFHPHTALRGFALVLNTNQQTLDDATAILNQLVTTDAMLIETPSHLALASLYRVSQQTVTDYIETILKHSIDCVGLVERLARVAAFAQPPTPFDTELLKDIDRKLHQARTSLKLE